MHAALIHDGVLPQLVTVVAAARAALIAVAEENRAVFWDAAAAEHRPLAAVVFEDPEFTRLCRREPTLLALLARCGVAVVRPPEFVRVGLRAVGVATRAMAPALLCKSRHSIVFALPP